MRHHYNQIFFFIKRKSLFFCKSNIIQTKNTMLTEKNLDRFFLQLHIIDSETRYIFLFSAVIVFTINCKRVNEMNPFMHGEQKKCMENKSHWTRFAFLCGKSLVNTLVLYHIDFEINCKLVENEKKSEKYC